MMDWTIGAETRRTDGTRERRAIRGDLSAPARSTIGGALDPPRAQEQSPPQ